MKAILHGYVSVVPGGWGMVKENPDAPDFDDRETVDLEMVLAKFDGKKVRVTIEAVK